MPEISKFFGWCMLIWATLSNVGGSVAMKYFHQTRSDVATTQMSLMNPDLKYIGVALICYISSFVSYFIVLKVIPISIAYPIITGLTILMVLGVANSLLGEQLSISMAVGAAFIVVGIFLIGGKFN